jgi:hypothetical protein
MENSEQRAIEKCALIRLLQQVNKQYLSGWDCQN